MNSRDHFHPAGRIFVAMVKEILAWEKRKEKKKKNQEKEDLANPRSPPKNQRDPESDSNAAFQTFSWAILDRDPKVT